MAKIAVMGYGVVGSGTVEVFYKNKASLERKTGQELDIKYILDLKEFPESPYADKFTKDFNDILNDDEVSVVAEVIGGINPAYTFVKQLLQKGKSVVSSNKELVAKKGAELLAIAKEKNVNFFFEASVGGGIPIIQPLHQSLAANEINEIVGILNGTTNYILTKMIREGDSFESALKTAQKLGYAERDPSADVDGHDTCRKICILASLAFGRHIYPDNIHTEGIRNVTLEDVEYAESFGGAIKLIGWAKQIDNGNVQILTCPALVSDESQLYSVNDVFNAILVRGDSTGDVVFYGKGAGKLPTASAVVSDIVDAIKNKGKSKSLHWDDSEQDFVDSYENIELASYIRFSSQDILKAKSDIKNLFGEVQYLSKKHQNDSEIAFITPVMKEYETQKLCNELESSGTIVSRIRVLID